MDQLNLPAFDYRTRFNQGKEEIFDPVRRKFVALTPEEWVRQHFVNYLVSCKLVPPALISVEQTLTYNTMKKRADIVVYSRKGNPLMMIECKAASVEITQKTFDQVARYNLTMKVPYLVVTNGLVHICSKVDFENSTYAFLAEIPGFEDMGS